MEETCTILPHIYGTWRRLVFFWWRVFWTTAAIFHSRVARRPSFLPQWKEAAPAFLSPIRWIYGSQVDLWELNGGSMGTEPFQQHWKGRLSDARRGAGRSVQLWRLQTCDFGSMIDDPLACLKAPHRPSFDPSASNTPPVLQPTNLTSRTGAGVQYF